MVKMVLPGDSLSSRPPLLSSSSVVAASAVSQDQERHVQLSALPVARHVCADCNTMFRSGEVLSGHMRKHWFPGKQQARDAPVDPSALPHLILFLAHTMVPPPPPPPFDLR
jgi:hypothetical protein